MAVHSLFPSFVQIHYHSSYGKHVQTIQTRQWNAAGFTHGFGGYTTWAGASIEADDMVNQLIGFITPWADTDVAWDECIIFNYPAPPPTLPNPVIVFPLTQIGLGPHTVASKALQLTMNYYDPSFNLYKMVLLDVDPTGSFDPLNFAGLPVLKQALVGYMTSDAHAFASRADLRPTVFRQAVWKYNDKLRKEYHQN